MAAGACKHKSLFTSAWLSRPFINAGFAMFWNCLVRSKGDLLAYALAFANRPPSLLRYRALQ